MNSVQKHATRDAKKIHSGRLSDKSGGLFLMRLSPGIRVSASADGLWIATLAGYLRVASDHTNCAQKCWVMALQNDEYHAMQKDSTHRCGFIKRLRNTHTSWDSDLDWLQFFAPEPHEDSIQHTWLSNICRQLVRYLHSKIANLAMSFVLTEVQTTCFYSVSSSNNDSSLFSIPFELPSSWCTWRHLGDVYTVYSNQVLFKTNNQNHYQKHRRNEHGFCYERARISPKTACKCHCTSWGVHPIPSGNKGTGRSYGMNSMQNNKSLWKTIKQHLRWCSSPLWK